MKARTKRGQGRPKSMPGMAKVRVTFRVHPWIYEWLKMQPETNVLLLEEALLGTYPEIEEFKKQYLNSLQ